LLLAYQCLASGRHYTINLPGEHALH
jgi:hypothetical protein